MKLDGRTALVTGAGRGIGRGCALQLARNGAHLILNDRPGSPDLADTASDIQALGRECQVVEANVFERAGCQQLVDRAVELSGGLDILVSNPARGYRQPFLEFDPLQFEEVIRCTLVAGFHVSQLVARHFVEQGRGGKIVFISSIMAEMPIAGSSAYVAAKAGLNQLAAVIAVELLEHRVNVNVIEPGWIDTPGERATFGDDFVREGGPQLPWGRLGEPEDIGKAAAFLASDDADYVTGSVIRVDGGFFLKDFRLAHSIQPPPPQP